MQKGLKRLEKVKLASVGCCLGTTRMNLEFSGSIDIMKTICSKLQSQVPKRVLIERDVPSFLSPSSVRFTDERRRLKSVEEFHLRST